MSSIWGIISGLFPLPKADFQNILASEGIREGEAIWASSGRYSVLSNQQDLLHVPSPCLLCKEISISIIYNIIIYIDITSLASFSVFKEIG